MPPLISVILPVRNCEKFLPEAISSILGQSVDDFELIIINDGSTDASGKIAESYTDSRIHVVHESGKGLVHALNCGIRCAKSDLIARMDADDISHPNRFEQQVKFFRNRPDIGILFTQAVLISESGKRLGASAISGLDSELVQKGLLFEKKMPPLIHPSVMIRTHLLKKLGGYRNYIAAEDCDLWLRASKITGIAQLDQELLTYRVLASGVCRSNRIQQLIYSILSVINHLVIKNTGVDVYVQYPDLWTECVKRLSGPVNQLRIAESYWMRTTSLIRQQQWLQAIQVAIEMIFCSGTVRWHPILRSRDSRNITEEQVRWITSQIKLVPKQ